MLTPLPPVKNEMTKSSIDSVNASKADCRIAGLISGNIILYTHWPGVAPKSKAASGKELSIVFKRGMIDSRT